MSTDSTLMNQLLTGFKSLKYQSQKVGGLLTGIALMYMIFKFFGCSPHESITNCFIFIICVSTIIFGWFYFRRIPIFSGKTIGILLAPHTDESLAEDLERLEDEVEKKLKELSLGRLFTIRSLNPSFKIPSVDEAYRLRDKTKAFLIIWGSFEKGNIGGSETRGFPYGKLNFTYAVPPASESLKAAYGKDISIGTVDRRWFSKNNNDFIERDYVSQNIVEVAMFIIGTCLMSFGKSQMAEGLFTELLRAPRGKWVGSNGPLAIRNFIINIQKKLAYCFIQQANGIYREHIFKDGRFINAPTKIKTALNLIEKSLQRTPLLDAYSLKAIFHFLLGDIPASKRAIGKSKEYGGRSLSGPDYSMGFLYAFEGNLDKANRYYLRALGNNQTLTSEFILHLIEFVQATLTVHPDRFHLYYVSGILNKNLFDREMAKKDFTAFIKAANEKHTDRQWVSNAEKEIIEIERENPNVP